ncbi:hypothetical protein C2S52_001936 [Perilla frutescens var. hirtella]|nr:hypothetical protein C2S52_001936 [Perilla frutescens var. hirtella]
MNKRGKSDIESNEEIPLPESESTPTATGFQDSKDFSTRSGTQRSPRSDCQSMYEAAIDGNSATAVKLLSRDPSLAFEVITETGDRALHVAVYMKNTEFVRELVKGANPSELELHDGRGYSPCCYAARTGEVEVADIMMKKNANLGSKRNRQGTTPLQLAVFYGNAKLALQFLRSAQVDDLLEQEWVDLLLVTVHGKMCDVASAILEKDASLAVKKDIDQQTALHVLAQLDLSSSGCKSRDYPKMEHDLRNLAKKLWVEIQKLERDNVLELMKNPPILHDAAKVGNVELIIMITHAYPDLLGHTNNKGHSIYHIAVMYQQECVLELIKQPENIIDFKAISEDINGDNILHLAGKLQPPDGLKIVYEPDLQMKKSLAWFKEVEKAVPPFFAEKKNKNGYKPREVFWKEHKSLLEESGKHLKSTAESGMLVSTIILTVVFAAAFTPPGGYHQDTGLPLLLIESWFSIFVIFDVLALFSSTYSIISFWSILSSNYEEDQFLSSPKNLRHALTALLLSLLCAISAFLSTFFLVFVDERRVLVLSFMLPVYVLLVIGVSFQFFKLFPKTNILGYYSRKEAS